MSKMVIKCQGAHDFVDIQGCAGAIMLVFITLSVFIYLESGEHEKQLDAVQDLRRITNQLRGIYDIYFKF